MADTAEEASNNVSDAASDDKVVKVNGEMNGSYCDGEEPMDVDSDSAALKHKLLNSKSSNSDDDKEAEAKDEVSETKAANETASNEEEKVSSRTEEDSDSLSNSNSKVNGEMNGSHCDKVEAMEVDAAVPNSNVSSTKSSDEDADTVPEEKSVAEDISKEDSDNVDSSIDPISSEMPADESSKEGSEDGGKEKDVEDGDSPDVDGSKDEADSCKKESNDLNSTDVSRDGDNSEATPEKGKKSKKAPATISPITPRRSSRNLNKQKSTSDNDKDISKLIKESVSPSLTIRPVKAKNDDDEIEEIVPVDPLAGDSSSPSPQKLKNKTIVVNDTKRLAEIAGSKHLKTNKKEPTLVIIDTNAILSGRGPVPISSSGTTTHINIPSSRSSGFSMLPVALPAQGMYPQIRATTAQVIPKPVVIQASAKPQPAILPTLTDDMFVVEAPSFIVPYVYEKPPVKPLKGYLDKMDKEIKREAVRKVKEEEEKEKKAKEARDAKEAEEKEKKADEDEAAKGDSEAEGEAKKDDSKMEVDEPKSEDKDSSSETKKDEEKEDEPKDEKSEKEEEKKEDGKKAEAKEEVKEPEKKEEDKPKKSSHSYFDAPLGKFFMQIGINLVQEYVQTDLLRSQKRKLDKEGAKCTADTQAAIESLSKTLEFSKENNDPFRLPQRKCEYCSFKTESALVMAHHLETPHMKNYVYRCNFCPLEVRSPHDILYHMEAEHNIRGRLERAPAFHQCPSCPFEDNQKGKLTRHLISCGKKYRPERNQEAPLDWEPPAKIPRVTKNRPTMSPGNAVYQAAMSGLKQGNPVHHPLLPKLAASPMPTTQGLLNRGRGRPQGPHTLLQRFPSPVTKSALNQAIRPGMIYRPSGSNSQPQVLLPTSYQISGNQLFQSIAGQKNLVQQQGLATAKLLNQPSISITPLPRQGSANQPAASQQQQVKPGRPPTSAQKGQFVICEICDGYIKDLEQLRNHMQWIHKVKIHPKMIYNRPPLNCQKCQFRFFTDQGLERHLLGSHGLVTSSMQEAANKGKDGGRCPVCGRVYQWKLLNHVARDHNMSLKPAHLSYKCTVCTATFGMYKQFENHVYSAHSVVAKRVMDKKVSSPQPSTSSNSQNESLLKPLKINDEITIIPQPARSSKPSSSTSSAKNMATRQPVKKTSLRSLLAGVTVSKID
ncbi:unnamed protein product [Bemisia tabaci]|uniref:MOG interacting and ectopic P-granules protein 1 n=1 Tax=Bemisia tabaci TaxID=7038 RepID=A0A9P0C4H1_BEMTA|nr:unnamed protein product [Bemisia tabaci]